MPAVRCRHSGRPQSTQIAVIPRRMGERVKSTRGGDFTIARKLLDKAQTSFCLCRGLLREDVHNNVVTFPSRFVSSIPQMCYGLK